MTNLSSLPARSQHGAFYVVVESPRGSRAKIKYDPELGDFKFSRPLLMGLRYPYDWGFIPSTTAPDGDPLDAMVFNDLPTFPGVVIECRTLGVIRLQQNRKKGVGRERNDRLVAIPIKMPRLLASISQPISPCTDGKSWKNFFLRRRVSKERILRFSGGEALWKVNGWSIAAFPVPGSDTSCKHPIAGP